MFIPILTNGKYIPVYVADKENSKRAGLSNGEIFIMGLAFGLVLFLLIIIFKI